MRPTTRALLPLVIAIVAACGPSVPTIPTEPEARVFLNAVVSAAQAGDMDQLCELANCLRDDLINPPAAPAKPPTVIGTRVLDPLTLPDGQHTLGGLVLILCGLDAESQPFRSEMLVFRTDAGLHTPSFKYWLNGTIGGDGSPTTASEPPIPADCD